MLELRLARGSGRCVLGKSDKVGKVQGQESMAPLRKAGDWGGLECGT